MAELNNLVVNGVARVNGELYENQTRVATSASVAAVQNIITTNSASWAADTKVTAVGNHYTPAQSAGKAAAAGSVISGLGVDAKGHVVAVTGSNSITSASRAVSASRADAANSATTATSASFATNASQLGGKAASQYASASHTHAYSTPAQVTASINALVTASGSAWSQNTDTKVTAVGNHYTPAQSAGKSVSAGSCISGLGVDAAGHVVAVTGSNSITSASWAISASRAVSAASANSATSATTAATASCLGAGANTSASVAAAINAKWTYNENTIKAVKVTSASRADSAASATSATTANTASYVTWANVAGKPSTFAPSAHTHNLIVTEGDYRATASVPNDYNNNLRFRGLKNNSTIGLTIGTGSYAYVLGLRGWSDSSGGDSHELAFNNAGIFTRHGATTTWGSWNRIITSDLTSSMTVASASEAVNATKLGGKAANQYASASHTHAYVAKTGDTMSGQLTFSNRKGITTIGVGASGSGGWADSMVNHVFANKSASAAFGIYGTANTVNYAYIGVNASDVTGAVAYNTTNQLRIYPTYVAWGGSRLITSADTASWATAAANSHTHANKAVLDAVKAQITGSVGNTGSPVYFNAGVPTAITRFSGTVTGSLQGNVAGTASYATSASRAVSAASATSATSAGTASCLGVAANTSASVAAAINAKWTYNATTIQGVKVNNATAADKLVGTSGSAGLPVYFNAGVPTACTIGQISSPAVSGSGTSGTIALQMGTVTNLGTLTGNVTFTLAQGNTTTNGHIPIYHVIFNMGATVRTINLPSGVTLMDGSAAMNVANKTYEISIMNNVAIINRTA